MEITSTGTWNVGFAEHKSYMSSIRHCPHNDSFLNAYAEVLSNKWSDIYELPFTNDDYAVWCEDDNGEFTIGTYFLIAEEKYGHSICATINRKFRKTQNPEDIQKIIKATPLGFLHTARDLISVFGGKLEMITGFTHNKNSGSTRAVKTAGCEIKENYRENMFLFSLSQLLVFRI